MNSVRAFLNKHFKFIINPYTPFVCLVLMLISIAFFFITEISAIAFITIPLIIVGLVSTTIVTALVAIGGIRTQWEKYSFFQFVLNIAVFLIYCVGFILSMMPDGGTP